MSLPIFGATDDPGPNFLELLRRTSTEGFGLPGPGASGGASSVPGALGDIRHGTTVLALRYADGVVMAGDRRATTGTEIAHRAVEKVLPADSHSGVCFAGAASTAIEMVKLFQTQLEHYEKVEGTPLSLEGKANQLGQMIRQHLPMAMQGFVVVPLFAGFDLRRGRGRIFTYDPTGGPYEEEDFSTTGSGGRLARTAIKLAFHDGMPRDEAVEVAIQALYEAADEDTATGGPDVIRGIYPTVATITGAGFERVPEEQVAERFGALIDRRTAEGRPR
ncbi:MAG TPA: proteasome subunit beta [Acidimicrobiales bacterium]|nr:proteasome subunit beta [Acidimicrobiales bacterium]